MYQHTYKNVEHTGRANETKLFTCAFDQTAVLTIIESKRASLLNYKQAFRDQRIHGDGFWVVGHSSFYEEDGGM